MTTPLDHPVPAPSADAADLAAWLRGGDETAFTRLADRHAPAVLGTCRRILGPGQDADDACQATLVLLYRKGRGIRNGGRLPAWLHRTAVLACRQVVRQEKARRRREEQAMQDHPRTVDAPPDDEWERVRPHLDEALESLPAGKRAVLVRHFLGGERLVDAAAALGISPEAARKRRDEGLTKLRRWFGRRGIAVGALAAILGGRSLAAEVPPALPGIRTAGGGVSPAAQAIAQGVSTAMFLKQISVAACAALLFVLTGFAAFRLAAAEAGGGAAPPPAPPPVPADPPAEPQPAHATAWRAWTIPEAALPHGCFSPDGRHFLYSPAEVEQPEEGSPIVAWSLDDGQRHLRISRYREDFHVPAGRDARRRWTCGPVAVDDRLHHLVVQQVDPALPGGLSWWFRIPPAGDHRSPAVNAMRSGPIYLTERVAPFTVAPGAFRPVPGRAADGRHAAVTARTRDGALRVLVLRLDGEDREKKERTGTGYAGQPVAADLVLPGYGTGVVSTLCWDGSRLVAFGGRRQKKQTKTMTITRRRLWPEADDGPGRSQSLSIAGGLLVGLRACPAGSNERTQVYADTRAVVFPNPDDKSHINLRRTLTCMAPIEGGEGWQVRWSSTVAGAPDSVQEPDWWAFDIDPSRAKPVGERTECDAAGRRWVWQNDILQLVTVAPVAIGAAGAEVTIDCRLLRHASTGQVVAQRALPVKGWFAPLRDGEGLGVRRESVHLIVAHEGRRLLLADRYRTVDGGFHRHAGRLVLVDADGSIADLGEAGGVLRWESVDCEGGWTGMGTTSAAPLTLVRTGPAVAVHDPATQTWRVVNLGLVPGIGRRVVLRNTTVRAAPDTTAAAVHTKGDNGVSVFGFARAGTTLDVTAVEEGWCRVAIPSEVGTIHARTGPIEVRPVNGVVTGWVPATAFEPETPKAQ